MTESSGTAVLYTAVYDDVDAALADLAALEQLHKAELVGKYDAAVIDVKDGEPHIVKRVDHPVVRVIPEWLGSGTLARRELHDAARPARISHRLTIRPIAPTTIRITPTVEMLMPATWAVTANLRIAPRVIADKLKPMVIVRPPR